MRVYFDILPVLFYALLPALAASISFNLWLSKTNLKSQPFVDRNRSAEQLAPKLLSGWWTDETRFQAEKRAVFSQSWICVTHRGRFTKAGDYFSSEMAGFRIFLILGKDGVVRAFHNVCRHRAYPVTKKAEGSSTILGCGYHGWSYNTTGQLTKAPHFDNTPGFKKEENGLFEIRTKVDEKGFLHVNFDRRDEARDGEVPPAVKIGRPVMIYQSSQYLCSWEVKGSFNWKVIVAHNDNHDIHEKSFLIETGIVSSLGSKPSLEINHMSQLRYGLTTYVYTKRGSPFWFLVTFSPDSASRTTLRCEAYSVKRQLGTLDEEVKQKWGEQLRLKVQGFERVYRAITRKGSQESGPTYGQHIIAEQVDVHLELETAKGKEINPAAVQSRGSGSSEAERLCRAVEYGAGGKLDW